MTFDLSLPPKGSSFPDWQIINVPLAPSSVRQKQMNEKLKKKENKSRVHYPLVNAMALSM